MRLAYLLFDFSDEESGACSFDAMACAVPARVPALVHEVEAVLAWAHRAFGAPSGADDDAEWAYELQATGEQDDLLPIAYDAKLGRVTLPDSPGGRVTIALTVSGSRAFGDAFREAFPDQD